MNYSNKFQLSSILSLSHDNELLVSWVSIVWTDWMSIFQVEGNVHSLTEKMEKFIILVSVLVILYLCLKSNIKERWNFFSSLSFNPIKWNLNSKNLSFYCKRKNKTSNFMIPFIMVIIWWLYDFILHEIECFQEWNNHYFTKRWPKATSWIISLNFN